MPLTGVTFRVLEACFSDTEFKKELRQFLESVKSGSITDREALSIIRISLNDPDRFDSAVELLKIDCRDLFMAAEHGQLNSHLEWADCILAAPPQSVKLRSKVISVKPDERGIIECPKCGFRLNVMKTSSAWNGVRHLRCGQRLNVTT